MKNFFKRSAQGAAVPHHKATKDISTVKMPVPSKIVLPMSQHIGAPATPVVKKGDKVLVGSLVGQASGFVSSNIYSGVSGEVVGIADTMLPNGNCVPTVAILPDNEQTVAENITPPVVTDRESFVEAVKQSGLTGLGGAGFPTFIKLSPQNLSEIDTLVINGAECEPYITADNREFLECGEDVIAGIMLVQKYLGVKKAVIGIERNKPEAIDLMFSLTKGDDTISVKPLKSRYPQGAEKILIEKCTGREIPKGALPSSKGVIVMNVATVSFISKYLKTGMPLTTKRVTVDGNAIADPKNVEVIIGTTFGEVIDFCGGSTQEVRKILSGGPMMGVSVLNTDFPVMKQCNAILAFGDDMAHQPQKIDCVRCGNCIAACPMGLSPVEIATAYKRSDLESLEKLNIDVCMDCGCCTFVCPSKCPVSQTVKLSKEFKRRETQK